MPDRSPLQLYVHHVSDADRPAVLAAIAAYGLDLEFTEPQCAEGEIALSYQYVYFESAPDSGKELAAYLLANAPGAEFEIWQDPATTESDGLYVGHVPGIGTYEAACDGKGRPYVPVTELAASLINQPAGTTVARFLGGEGRKLLGTDVLTALARRTRKR